LTTRVLLVSKEKIKKEESDKHMVFSVYRVDLKEAYAYPCVAASWFQQ
jgi:hypothetical protein